MSGTWELTLKGRILGQETINKFYYFSDVEGSNALTLANAFPVQVLPDILTVTSEKMNYYGVEVNGIIDTPDIASVGFDYDGLRTGECLPSFCAWSFRLNRTNNLFRNGYKRFAGISEGSQEDGVPVPTMLTDLQTLEATLASQIVVDSDVYDPVIIQKFKDGMELDPWTIWPFQTATFIRLSSQVSRKVGHGS